MSDSPPTDNPIDSELEKLKIDSERKPVEFSDLTTDVLKVIIEKSQLKERLILRKVSNGLRALVDDQKSILTDIGFVSHRDRIYVYFNKNYLVYTDPKLDLRECRHDSRYHDAKVIRSEDYLRVALDDLKSAVKDPTLQLDVLNVEFFSSYGIRRKKFSKELDTILKSLNHKISTKTFEIRAETADHILAILPYLTPGTLRCIEFRQCRSSWRISDAEFDRIAELEQWKQAKVLGLRYANDMWPEKHLMHFEEFNIFDWSMSAEKIRKWRDIFSKSKNFIACQIDTKDGFYPKQIQNHISEGVPTLLRNHFSHPIYLIEHPIRDDPNQYLEIKVFPVYDGVLFKKLTRKSS